MAAGVGVPGYVVMSARETPRPSGGVPWYLWAGVIAVTSSTIGGAWDVSWHRTIGRDSFWTPAHMLIYACGVIAGIVGLYLVWRSTVGGDEEMRRSSVSVFGLRAPLGVFLAGWGGVAMLTSAPFDNWWHSAYGLDVKIVSPPHTLLILGIRTIGVGILFLILAAMNRAEESGAATFKTLQVMFLYVCGLGIGGQMFFLQEYTWDIALHQMSAYIAMGIALPVMYGLYWQSSRYKWSATVTSAVYMAFIMAEILILPLFPAQPKLGPVFNPVTHMVPAKFPILLIVPALALDLLWQKIGHWKPWQIAVVSGVVFVAVIFAVEWPFANFLMSPAGHNRFFGTIYSDYTSRPNGYDRMRIFFRPEHGMQIVRGLLIATACAIPSCWVGLRFGRWMRGVQR